MHSSRGRLRIHGTATPSTQLQVTGSIKAGTDGAGSIQLYPGNSNQAGSLSIYKGDGVTRLGYIGFDNANMRYQADNGSHVFAGPVQATTLAAGAASDQIVTAAADGTLRQRSVASVLQQGTTTNTLTTSGNSITSSVNGVTSTINAPNIYTTDGTLTGSRTVAMGGNSLNFSGTGVVRVRNDNAGQGNLISAFGTPAADRITFADENTATGTGPRINFNAGNTGIIGGNGNIALLPSGNVGIGTTTPSRTLDVNGQVRIQNIPSGGGSFMLTADEFGIINKQAIPPASTSIIFSQLGSGVDLNSGNWNRYNYSGSTITIPANSKYIVQITMLLGQQGGASGVSSVPMPGSSSIWMRSTLSDSPNNSAPAGTATADIVGSPLISGIWGSNAPYGIMSGSIIIQNKQSTPKTYYYMVGYAESMNYNGGILRVGGNGWGENYFYAIPTTF